MEGGFLRRISELLWPLAITVAAAALVTLAYFAEPAYLELLELKAYDLRISARGAQEPSGQVVIAAVDEESLERVGRWPWDREVTAKLARRLDALNPKAVGYDISFSYPQSSEAGQELVRLVRAAKSQDLFPISPPFVRYVKQRLAATNPDGRLAKALAGSASPQILGYHFNLDPEAAEREQAAAHTLARAARYIGVKQVDGAREANLGRIPRGYRPKTNIPVLAEHADSQAYFNVLPDPDGTVRRYPLVMAFEGKHYQPLASALFDRALPRAMPVLLATRHGMIGAQWDRHVVRTDPRGRMLVNYLGPAGTIPHVPAWKILEGEAPAELFEDRYVLAGVTAPTVYDLRVTPAGVAYPGLEIHATVLDNMLSQNFIVRPGWAPMFDIAAIWVFALLTLVFLWRMRPLFSAPAFFALAGLFVWINNYFFTVKQFWLGLVYPLLAFLGTYLLLIVYRFMFSDRQKKQIKSAFSKYLDPGVVDQVTEDPGRLALGGEKCVLSILFSDIRDFTSISESLSPDRLVKLLNDYLTEMTDTIMSNKGLLDKYIGDAIMAVYGAPLHYPEHAELACRSALLMKDRLEKLNRAWSGQGAPPLAMGIGINTGEVVAGNMGSHQRFDYTVMGDNVNLASRLEGLTKNYGVSILISAATQAEVAETFWTRTIDLVRVKGKTDAVEIFELQAEITESQPLEYMPEYLEMVEAYRQGRFFEALDMAEGLATEHPEDKVCAVYRDRLQALAADPPDGWDGVYTFTSK
jgi:adenylate cyclase